ncbi:MAG TPA: acyl-CoA dehydrogenase family protein [Streptosporangiaceae bacterium]|nr:acyl-CoA dehydrogenase family protein [Streptosporangiaceae bacterium]
MDFSESETQQELSALARQILTERVTPARLCDIEEKSDRFDPELWAVLAEAGILSAALPDSLGGAGLGFLEQCSVLVEAGRTVAPVPYLACAMLGAGALATFASHEQHHHWAAAAGRGESILTAALSEEDGDDPRCPGAHAERTGGRWRLTGTKTAVPAAPLARYLLVPAVTPQGTAVFVVAASDDGVTVERQRATDGYTTGRVTLGGVALTDDRVLGDLGNGQEVTDWLVSRAMVGLAALQYGVAGRALELTAEYARNRVQFGRPIGSFQAVSQRLADAYVDVEAIRLTMWQAAWQLAMGLPSETEVATAKFWAADAGHRVAHTAVHVHGGMGIDTDYPLHRYFLAAKHHEFALGGATTQLRRIGAALASDS